MINFLKKLAWAIAIVVSVVAIYIRISYGEGINLVPGFMEDLITVAPTKIEVEAAEAYLEGRYSVDFKYEDYYGVGDEKTFYFSTPSLGYNYVAVVANLSGSEAYYEDDYYSTLYAVPVSKYLRRVFDSHLSTYMFHFSDLSGVTNAKSPLYFTVEDYVLDSGTYVTAVIEVPEYEKDIITQNLSSIYSELDSLFYRVCIEIYVVPEDEYMRHESHELWELYDSGAINRINIDVT